MSEIDQNCLTNAQPSGNKNGYNSRKQNGHKDVEEDAPFKEPSQNLNQVCVKA